MLLKIGNDALGHCTTHTMTMTSDSKERAVKPAASVAQRGSGLWRQKSVTGLNIALHGEGFIFAGETEMSYARLLSLMADGEPVEFACFQRSASPMPYVTGFAVITNLERVDPADDDSTYSIDLEVSGTPSFIKNAFYNAPAGDTAQGPTTYAGIPYPEPLDLSEEAEVDDAEQANPGNQATPGNG